MRRSLIRATKKGMAGILAAIIFFGVIFTVLYTYVITEYDTNQLLEDTISARALRDVEQQDEDFSIGTMLIDGSDKKIGFAINNTGQNLINIISVFVNEPSGEIANKSDGSKAVFSGSPLFSVSAGTSSSVFNTDVVYSDNQGVFMVRVLSEKGNIGSAPYPRMRVAVGDVEGFEDRLEDEAEGVTKGALGQLLLNFTSFQVCVPADQDCAVSNFGIAILEADAIGSADQWTLGAGSDKITAVNSPDDEATSYITDSGAANQQLFRANESSIPAGATIDAIRVIGRAESSESAAQELKFIVRDQDGTTSDASGSLGLTKNNWKNFEGNNMTMKCDSTAWGKKADVFGGANEFEFGVQGVSGTKAKDLTTLQVEIYYSGVATGGGDWSEAWEVNKGDNILFRITIRNTGNTTYFLSENTVIAGIGELAGGGLGNEVLFIKGIPSPSDEDGPIYDPDFGFALTGGSNTTLYFGAKSPGGDTLAAFQGEGIWWTVLIIFAYEDVNENGVYDPAIDTAAYGQTMPFEAGLIVK